MAQYNKLGLTFMYPENWTLSEQAEDELENAPREISLESPTGCLWVLHVFDSGTPAKGVLTEVVQGLDQQYEDFEFNPLPDCEILNYKTIGGDADFYCLDFLVTARIQVINTSEFVFSVLNQAESRDFDKMEQVFLAITTSLLKSELPSSV